MESTADIWGAFLRTGSVLVFVIALLLLFLYAMKRFSLISLAKSDQKQINILEVHHFSPKEKLVLVDVMNERLLLGVTPQTIRTLSITHIPSHGNEKKKEPKDDNTTC